MTTKIEDNQLAKAALREANDLHSKMAQYHKELESLDEWIIKTLLEKLKDAPEPYCTRDFAVDLQQLLRKPLVDSVSVLRITGA